MSDQMFMNSIKLLVVDDAAAIRSSISALLTEIGYVVRTAVDGFEALSAIRMDIPNILLSDLNMPGHGCPGKNVMSYSKHLSI